MIDINFKTKLKELISLPKSWQHGKLALMGKITLIKTLALPKIIHIKLHVVVVVVVVVVVILYFLQHIEDFTTELNRQKITLQTGVKKKRCL